MSISALHNNVNPAFKQGHLIINVTRIQAPTVTPILTFPGFVPKVPLVPKVVIRPLR